MEAFVIKNGHDIEEERIGVIVKSLVIQKQFRQQTQVLRIVLKKKCIQTYLY